ncbi:hypothetical protein BJX63DRAFT_379097 [Aspergillus granulosus]|uniref:Uncharacterized protein n=1 Tax=Aspergillus granulosus TaxID=176169 RepID=A0ABR4I0B2_9EURO
MDTVIQRPSFEETLRAAVQQRSIQYTASYSLSLRWEADDTQAFRDASHFQTILRLLNLPAAEELIISRLSEPPAWDVQSKFRKVLSKAMNVSGRALVVVHYAGLGYVDSDGSLKLVECIGGRAFNAERYLFSVVDSDQDYINDNGHIDVLFILDCCYGFVADRAAETCSRIVEIVAATTDSNPVAFGPPGVAVTVNLVAEITRRQREGHQYIEIADLVATIRKDLPVKKPGHCLKLGARSICLPFTGLASVNPALIQPSLRAVFSVHLLENMTSDDITRLLNWIRTLPQFASITLDGVYPTGSTCLVLSSAWSVWSKLSGMTGFKLITETASLNIRQSAA